ncbi:hypothetical protein OG689_10905 [Kitasatospora sp. NBC_00240]|uniref:hypothetical protein n=1 Tax=Kitasatospora sp. NBC_00240 TaxID=2903567 RepID=UPI0022501518|nr:hypothetical protein [Kitasatospora sp. NBC_00240]MCX5209793.1 hypothetical protein [Kitasatospora sp. NBC_00240]
MKHTPISEFRTFGGARITIHRATLFAFWFRGYGWKCSGCGTSQSHTQAGQPVQLATAEQAADTHASTCRRVPA